MQVGQKYEQAHEQTIVEHVLVKHFKSHRALFLSDGDK